MDPPIRRPGLIPPDPPPPRSRYYIGVDPGQSIDPTAIAIVGVEVPTPGQKPVYRVGHLERLPLNTPYPGIVWRVKDLRGRQPFARHSEVVLDLTGVGRPVNDLFRDRGVAATCVTITAGHEEVKTGSGFYSVPKITLVSRVQSLLHDSRLQIQKDLPETPALVAELQDFRATVTDSGRWTFGARAGAHDDLVLAVALACWRASRPQPIRITPEMLAKSLEAPLVPRRRSMIGSPGLRTR